MREVVSGKFVSFDGTELSARTWKPLVESDEKKALIVLHRGHEHAGRLDLLVNEIGLDDFWAFGFDARGHGNSPGERGYAESLGTMIKDLDSFVSHIAATHDIPVENMVVVANSVAAVICSCWVHDYGAKIRAMVLAAPAFSVKLYVPFALPSLRLAKKLSWPKFITSYVKPKVLTHDPEQVRAYQDDKLIASQIAVNILIDLFDYSARVIADAGTIHTPTLVLSSGSDWVVKNSYQKKFFERLSSEKKEMVVYPDFYHGIFYEKDRALPLTKTKEFVLKCFEHPPSLPDYINADQTGYTKEEYERLQKPIRLDKRLFYGVQKFSMSTLGRLSKGIRIGLETGFDSGLSLDHVYKNRATGITPIGKLLDRTYLDAIGWRGIRQRKVHLESQIEYAIEQLLKEEKPVRLMDVAAGGGRYMLELAQKYKDRDLKLLLRDHDSENLDACETLAKELGVENALFQEADAFDENSFKKEEFTPNIVVVSGLYELFPENNKVLASLKGIASIMESGGYIIYTGQPWHPQLEMIAATLRNRDGVPWVMRRRTQAEMDHLVSVPGFQKLDMKIDEWGIFTVSIAKYQKN